MNYLQAEAVEKGVNTAAGMLSCSSDNRIYKRLCDVTILLRAF